MAERYSIVNAEVLLPGGDVQPKSIAVVDGLIEAVVEPGTGIEGEAIDADGMILSPGFIDIHVNGGGGASFESGDAADFQTIIDIGLRHGTTGMVGAINTAPPEDRIEQLEALDTFVKDRGDGPLLGVHLEGPYYHPDQRGAHKPSWIRHPDPDEYRVWIEGFGHLVRIVTLAPELPGGLDLLRALSNAGIVPAIGHTMATDADVDLAIEAGARLVTHIYNAQSTYTRNDEGKHLGVAEMGLLRDELTVEIIPDNRHLTPRMQQLIVKTKPHDLICITTDAMEATGQGPGFYEVMGGKVWVDDEVAYREDRKRHAGSILTMDKGVRNIVNAGASVGDALMMATEVPARTIGAEGKGLIVEGADADLVLLSKELRVLTTFAGGEVVYSGEGSPVAATQAS